MTQPDVIATTPGRVYAVPAPPFGTFTPQYIVTQPTVVVAPPAVAPRARVIERERVVVSPRRPAGVIASGWRTPARDRTARAGCERERVVSPRSRCGGPERKPGIVTTGSSRSRRASSTSTASSAATEI